MKHWNWKVRKGGVRAPRLSRSRGVLTVAFCLLLGGGTGAFAAPPAAQEPGTREQPPSAAGEPVVETGDEPSPETASDAGEPAEPLLDLERLAVGDSGDRLPVAIRARPLQGMPAAMAALMLGSGEGGQISLAPLATPILVPPPSAGSEASSAVALLIEMDGASLLGPSPPEETVVEIYAYALRPDRAVAAFLAQALPLDLVESGEAIFAGGLKFAAHLELGPGDYDLRVLVHEPASQRFGLSQVKVSVPQRAALLAPLVPEVADSPWLLAGEAPHGAMGALDFGRVLELAGVSMPAALPLMRGTSLPLDLLVYGAEGARLPASLEVRVRTSEGTAGTPLAAPVVDRSPTGLPGIERLRLNLPIESLPQGSYYLSFVAAGLGGPESTSSELATVVLHGDSVANQWTDIQRRLAGQAVPSLDFEEIQQRRRGRQKQIRTAIAGAYQQVLSLLADGNRQRALDGLVQVEREVLTSGQEAPLQLLQESEAEVLGAVQSTAPTALLPIALLHGRAYEIYRRDLDFGLSTHSRELAVGLVERYAARADEEAAPRIASAALASFGAYLQTVHVRTTGRQLLERALQLDPDNRFALIHLANGLEKTADYPRAIQVLERLVAIDPKSGEGRLRLAVNLRRLGRERQAEQWFRRLINEANDDWVLAVAYQELANLLLHRDQPGEAAALLQQAAGRLPGEGRIHVQLAYALDRTGELRRAQEVMAQVAPSPERESPRHTYNAWPDLGAEDVGQALQEAAMVRLPALRRTLSGMPGAAEKDLGTWAREQAERSGRGGDGGEE